MINNQWSNRYTVVEVTGLDRPGLLYELTADDLEAQPQHRLGACRDLRRARGRRVLRDRPASARRSPRRSRQAAIKRALLPLFVEEERKAAKAG